MTDATPAHRFPWIVPFLLALAFACAFHAVLGLGPAAYDLIAMDNDSAMRLVTVRDLLAGQGWFDPVQARLGPDGTTMHWSRLVDAPMAAIILMVEPFLGREGAEKLLVWLWPLVMLAAVAATGAGIAHALAGRLAGILAGVALTAGTLTRSRFDPGDIDHHSVQLLLLLLGVWGLMTRAEAPWRAGMAGAAIAMGICVGMETLPLLAFFCLAMAGLWAADGPAERRSALTFCAGLGGTLIATFAATAPPSAWRGGYCDAVSLDLVLPVLAGAGLLASLATWASSRDPKTRTALLAFGAAVIGAATYLAGSTCLANPYSDLDPILARDWLAHIDEAKGFVATLTEPVMADRFPVFVLGFLALAAGLLVRPKGAWLLISATMLTYLLAAYQVRATLYLMSLSVILLLTAFLTARVRGARALQLVIVAGLMLQSAAPWALQVGRAAWAAPAQIGSMDSSALPFDCLDRGTLRHLATLAPGLIAAGNSMGAKILTQTDHSALSAPYHRNEDGMLAQIAVMRATTDAEAEKGLRAAGVDYLLLCPQEAMPNAQPPRFPDRLLLDGHIPAFLTPLPTTGASRIWRVTPQS